MKVNTQALQKINDSKRYLSYWYGESLQTPYLEESYIITQKYEELFSRLLDCDSLVDAIKLKKNSDSLEIEFKEISEKITAFKEGDK